MDVLKIVLDELSYLPHKVNVSLKYVDELPFSSEYDIEGYDTINKCDRYSRYWLPWTDELGAWVSADGLRVEVLVAEDSEDSEITGALTIGLTSVIAATCLNVQNRVAIHANSVSFEGLAVAFVGTSGIGKSTLSTYCACQGAGFVTDDVLMVDSKDMVHPGNPRIKLYPHTAESLGLDAREETEYKIFFQPQDLGATLHQKPVPLGIIYLPAQSTNGHICSEQIDPIPAIFKLLSEGYYAASLLSDRPALFDAYANLVKNTPVRRLFYPRDFSLLPEVYQFISKEVKEHKHRSQLEVNTL